MRVFVLFIGVILHVAFPSFAQSGYELSFKEEKWNFSPTRFYLSEIIDERPDKKSAGSVLADGKSVQARFRNSLGADLKTQLLEATIPDTSRLPLILVFEKFELSETGNISQHKAMFNYSYKIYRVIRDKRNLLYEVSGNPSTEIRGAYPGVHEINIQRSLRKSLEGFNEWLIKNPNQTLLANKVVVAFRPASEYHLSTSSDTILWSENYKLNWSDFKGKPDPSSSFMAQSGTVFKYGAEAVVENGMMTLRVFLFSAFDKRTSWVLPGQAVNSLLAHEQLHFDICELNMRKLRKKIVEAELDVIEFSSQIEKFFNESWVEYQKQQQDYDDETQHGIVEDKQKAWEENIRKRLIEESIIR